MHPVAPVASEHFHSIAEHCTTASGTGHIFENMAYQALFSMMIINVAVVALVSSHSLPWLCCSKGTQL